jgi:uncharacterized phage protein (TIGR02220 family)
MNAIKEILLSNNFWALNKTVVKELGTDTALMLTVLAEAENIFENEWFYQTAETIENLTGFSNHIQTKCINKLLKLNMLEQKNQGIPMKRYFKLNYECISNQVFKNFENLDYKNLKTNIQKTSNNKEHINKKHINKKHNYKDIIPSIHFEYKSIIDYLNRKCNTNFKHTSKKTQSLIYSRYNEGFTTEDFKKVIETKSAKWLLDPKMTMYLRPETLFGTKFESYLNEKISLADRGIVSKTTEKNMETFKRFLEDEGDYIFG